MYCRLPRLHVSPRSYYRAPSDVPPRHLSHSQQVQPAAFRFLHALASQLQKCTSSSLDFVKACNTWSGPKRASSRWCSVRSKNSTQSLNVSLRGASRRRWSWSLKGMRRLVVTRQRRRQRRRVCSTSESSPLCNRDAQWSFFSNSSRRMIGSRQRTCGSGSLAFVDTDWLRRVLLPLSAHRPVVCISIWAVRCQIFEVRRMGALSHTKTVWGLYGEITQCRMGKIPNAVWGLYGENTQCRMGKTPNAVWGLYGDFTQTFTHHRMN